MTELVKDLSLANRYTLVSWLGAGGMAEVWLANDANAGKQVALKFLRPELAAKPEYLQLFETEAERSKQLSHPGIVRVFDLHADAGWHFIVLEYMPGGSLREQQNLHWSDMLHLLLPVTDALEYAHRAGFVHRDLRAANILLDKSGRPRLIDFGIAGAHEGAGTVMPGGGSLPSTSPQQLDDEAPAVADDVYGFGALMYELVVGEPLFHPEVTPERIRSVDAPRLSSFVADVPPELDRLVAAMLDKKPLRRPHGMAAVRVRMEELLSANKTRQLPSDESEHTLRPVVRQRAATLNSDESFKPRRLQDKNTAAGPDWRLYALFAGLALLVLGVVFVLPDAVENNKPPAAVDSVPAEEPVVAPEESATQDRVGRELADAALAELLRLSDRLRARSVELWGGADWFAAVNSMTAGDEAYKDRDYQSAATAYREALTFIEPLLGRVGEVLQSALTDGEQAIADGNQRLAIERFDLALAIEPGNLTAQLARDRALQLDRVIALVNEASAFEVAEQWPQAFDKYQQALAIDAEWIAAVEGRDRVGAVIAANEYQSSMSAGYAALVAEQYDAARGHFKAALGIRPGDQDASQALMQIDNDQRLARVSSLNRQAEQRVAAEDWGGAVSLYQAILAIDTSVTGARNGLAESKRRGELDLRMKDALASPDRLSDTPALEATRQLLDYARAVPAAGPVLSDQINELDSLLRRAVVPVSVRFESDNQTEVVIYKVGRFAPFASQNIQLRPGVYTAVGARSGYRDVRLKFRVQPDAAMQPVIIRCEDPI
jgi:serine/threonine protein kinase